MRWFRDRRADLLARGEAAGHPADVAATLGLALTRLGEEAPAAAGLLRLLACLAPDPVPLTLLLSDGEVTADLPHDAAATVGPLLGDPVAAGDAVAAPNVGTAGLARPAIDRFGRVTACCPSSVPPPASGPARDL